MPGIVDTWDFKPHLSWETEMTLWIGVEVPEVEERQLNPTLCSQTVFTNEKSPDSSDRHIDFLTPPTAAECARWNDDATIINLDTPRKRITRRLGTKPAVLEEDIDNLVANLKFQLRTCQQCAIAVTF